MVVKYDHEFKLEAGAIVELGIQILTDAYRMEIKVNTFKMTKEFPSPPFLSQWLIEYMSVCVFIVYYTNKIIFLG